MLDKLWPASRNLQLSDSSRAGIERRRRRDGEVFAAPFFGFFSSPNRCSLATLCLSEECVVYIYLFLQIS